MKHLSKHTTANTYTIYMYCVCVYFSNRHHQFFSIHQLNNFSGEVINDSGWTIFYASLVSLEILMVVRLTEVFPSVTLSVVFIKAAQVKGEASCISKWVLCCITMSFTCIHPQHISKESSDIDLHAFKDQTTGSEECVIIMRPSKPLLWSYSFCNVIYWGFNNSTHCVRRFNQCAAFKISSSLVCLQLF